MTANSFIDLTLGKIARDYQPGALVWMKVNRLNDWGNMLTLERSINKTALEGDLKGLREALNEYEGLILAMVRGFKALQEKKERGLFNFVERPQSPGTG